MKAIFLFMTVGLLSGLLEGKSCVSQTTGSPCASLEPRCPLGFKCENEQCVACPPGYAGPACEQSGCRIALGSTCTTGAVIGNVITIQGVITGVCYCHSICGNTCCFDVDC